MPTRLHYTDPVQDQLTAENLQSHLTGTLFAGAEKLHHFPTIGSTNLKAMEAAGQGAPEGSVFMADEQTAGRGRGGHSWASPPGQGIYVSVVLRPRVTAVETPWLSLIAGLAAHEAIQRTTGFNADLRWPNDVMAGGRKLGGILTESALEGGVVQHVVVGIGLNVNQPEFPAALEAIATSLRIETGGTVSRLKLAAALLQSLHHEYQALAPGLAEATSSILRRFEERSSYARGARVHVEEGGGYTGVTAGLDARGFLQVRTPEGLRLVLSGGVRKV